MANVKNNSRIRKSLTQKGIRTVEATLLLDTGQMVTTSVPGGVAIDKYSAQDLKDNDPKRFSGNGVSKAV